MKLLQLSSAIATILATNLSSLACAAEQPRKPVAQDKDIEVIYVHGKQHKITEIQYSKGISNADIFSGNPAIDSNNLRNEAGALDIGIRGVQGEGRVQIFIDGTLQSTHTNRGYMGTSDRSYIDSELISQLDVEKGATSRGSVFGAGAIGGTVNIRTLGTADILTEGQNAGALIKLKTHNNNRMPDVSGDFQQQSFYQVGSEQGVLDFRGGSATVATALQQDKWYAVAAMSQKKAGNYFAGEHGFDNFVQRHKTYDDLPPVDRNGEVVNTSFESKSYLAKLGIQFSDAHLLELNSRLHRQDAGEMLASYWYKLRAGEDKFWSELDSKGKKVWKSEKIPAGVALMPQWKPGTAEVDSHNLLYNFAPQGNALVNAKVNLWHTAADLEQYNALGSNLGPNAGQYFHRYHNNRSGLGLYNSSTLALADSATVTLLYGLSRQTEDLKPTANWLADFKRPNSPADWKTIPTSRHGRQEKQSIFANAQIDWEPVDLALNLNHHDSRNTDHQTGQRLDFKPKTDLTLLAGYQLFSQTRLFLKYSSAYRMPSLYESTVSNEVFSYSPDYPLSPEHSLSYEAGLEQQFEQLVTGQDQLQLKLTYFHTRINEMIATGFLPSKAANASRWDQVFSFTNYDKFTLPGAELELNYRHQNWYSRAAYTYYTDVEMCSALVAAAEKVPTCNQTGFSGSLTPLRIPPNKKWLLSIGHSWLQGQLDTGLTYHGHSSKSHPGGFLAGTAVKALKRIPAGYQIDLYANYRFNQQFSAFATINNLTDRYKVSTGSVVAMPEPGRTITLGAEIKF
jgi:hemoglobin/transferrin/lactoferrin receptor protein